jgi:integrase
MKAEKFPVTITERGVSAVIRKTTKTKAGKTHHYFIVEYILLGKRKQVWRSSEGKARATAKDACIKVSNGDQQSLELRNSDRLAYVRAVEMLAPVRIPIDTACREYVDALQILGGKASIAEACREWVKRNAVSLPKITVAAAAEKLKLQAIADKKSKLRQKQLRIVLARFAESFAVDVHTITPDLISGYLSALTMAERSKKNHRDVIGYFNRWLILRGYLPKGTGWLDGVQKYTGRKLGEIQIYTPDEMKLLLRKADKRLVPFLAIGAFAGLRHAEISRLDWSEIELADGAGNSFIEVRADKAKTQTRRLVPVPDNLKAWLTPHRKNAGKVCLYENTTKQLPRLASDSGVEWKHNGLRHSSISYQVAKSSNAYKVAEDCGNSVQVIRSNYLRRVKPAAADEWFSIMPPSKKTSRKLALENSIKTRINKG